MKKIKMTKYLKKSCKDNKTIDLRVQIMAFNATFNNYSLPRHKQNLE